MFCIVCYPDSKLLILPKEYMVDFCEKDAAGTCIAIMLQTNQLYNFAN